MAALISTDKAVELLSKGGIVALPTETVYGLAACACDEEAVLRVFQAKNRPTFNPLIVHVSSLDMLSDVVRDIPETATKLIDKYWPGPLSLLLDKSDSISDIVTAGSQQVVVRMPRHPLFLKVLNELNEPIVAPSANSFCRVSPTTAAHVLEQLESKIDGVVDGGPCEVGIESTIIGFDEERQPVEYRPGGVPAEAIESFLGRSLGLPKSGTVTPGSLQKHYAPNTQIILVDRLPVNNESEYIQVSFEKKSNSSGLYLSEDGSLTSAARRLYKVLHDIDSLEVEVAYIERAPDHGLGLAINDRLSRAAD